MGEIASAIVAALFKVFIGWWWNKHEASEADKAATKVAVGEAKIGETNEQVVNQENKIVATSAKVVGRVRADGDAVDGSGLRDGAQAINAEIQRSNDKL